MRDKSALYVFSHNNFARLDAVYPSSSNTAIVKLHPHIWKIAAKVNLGEMDNMQVRLSPKIKFFLCISSDMIRNYFDIDWYYSFAFLAWNDIAVAPCFLSKMPISNQLAPNKMLLLLCQFCTEWSETLDKSYYLVL